MRQCLQGNGSGMIPFDYPLEALIQSRITHEGPIPFRDFMDMCLYHPGLGYYTSGKERIGTAGDFYTSPSLTPIFGAMIACQIAEMVPYVESTTFTIVEYGGGNGKLSGQIMRTLRTFENIKCDIRYYIVEKNKTKQQFTCLDSDVQYIEKIEDLNSFSGVVISNELLDNFPVHRIVQQREEFEVFVDSKNNCFRELLRPASAELKEAIQRSGLHFPEGAQFEWNAAIRKWLNTIFDVMQKGFVLTIDYGDQQHRLISEYLNGGTISCYYNHQRTNNPYSNIGMQDITSDVNFSLLNYFAGAAGFQCTGFTSQAKFLLSTGMCGYIDKICKAAPGLNHGALLKSFVLEMGTRFKVMIHHKKITSPVLKGLQFAALPIA